MFFRLDHKLTLLDQTRLPFFSTYIRQGNMNFPPFFMLQSDQNVVAMITQETNPVIISLYFTLEP